MGRRVRHAAGCWRLSVLLGRKRLSLQDSAGKKTWYNERAIRIFRNPVEAEDRARLGQHESIELVKGTTQRASRWFWKANRYSTNNPVNAKGMPKWTAEDDMIHWMSDEEGRPYVGVLPDPAMLAQALSQTRPAPMQGE